MGSDVSDRAREVGGGIQRQTGARGATAPGDVVPEPPVQQASVVTIERVVAWCAKRKLDLGACRCQDRRGGFAVAAQHQHGRHDRENVVGDDGEPIAPRPPEQVDAMSSTRKP